MITKLFKNNYALFLLMILAVSAVFIIWNAETTVAGGNNSGGGNSGGTSGSGSSSTSEAVGCATQDPQNYSEFVAGEFNMTNVKVDDNTKFMVLDTGSQSIKPDNIVVPFDQEVSVTFISEYAGYTKTDFGWFFAKDVVLNADGTANYSAMATNGVINLVYENVNDNNDNGVLDKGESDSTNAYGDTNGDGKVDVWDNTKVLGKFTGGTELVFYLKVDNQNKVYYTKQAWNPDNYGAKKQTGITGDQTKYDKTYYLGVAGGEAFKQKGGWLKQQSIDRMKNYFGIVLEGSSVIPVEWGKKYPHVIVGAPPKDPNQWVLGWDDQYGDGCVGKSNPTIPSCSGSESDMDHNDLVFRINRKTGGTAALQPEKAIKPSDPEAYFTGVTIEVYDDMPCPGGSPPHTNITYSVSPDNGTTWITITSWDEVYSSDVNKTKGTAVSNWTPGTPQYTYRKARIDFASTGMVGQAFLWKAELVSDNDACVPRIMGVNFDFSVAKHAIFARSAPVAMVNMLYAGSYETPKPNDPSWTDFQLRGHLIATRLYKPEVPTKTDTAVIWDAGDQLSKMDPSARKIYFPDVTVVQVTSESVGTGDKVNKTFTGTLQNLPLMDGTLYIMDGPDKDHCSEYFVEDTGDVLRGSNSGTGKIDRYTGIFTVTFQDAPNTNKPIIAQYSYYKTSPTLKQFLPSTSEVTPVTLGLSQDWMYDSSGKKVYEDSYNGDNKVDQQDADWLIKWVRGYSKKDATSLRTWRLGAIDHSTPAVDVPPGRPAWYFGSSVTDDEREDFQAFAEKYKDRQAIVFAGSRDGMLHAFDGGIFQWGDNPETSKVIEYTGYFKWKGSNYSDDIYGTGDELWAYIPINLIGRLKNNYKGKSDQAFVDASPTVADVWINNEWRTILMAAEGDGGDTIFCLDITEGADPTKVKFLWEYSNPDLYRSKSSPTAARILQIKIAGKNRWVALFVSGTSNTKVNPSIYVVDIANGKLLKRVFLDAMPGLGTVPSGQPAVVDFDGDGYIDRLYIGTAKAQGSPGTATAGYLYKVNITGDDTAWPVCVLNTSVPEFDSIYGTPVAIVDRGYSADGSSIEERVLIFYGTGDSPYLSDIDDSKTYSFFGFEDKDGPSTCSAVNAKMVFKKDLDAGEKIWASAFASAGRIYFGTTTADTEDPCDGYDATASQTPAHLYVFDQKATTGTSEIYKISTPNLNVPPLVDDGHLYIRGPSGKITSYGSGNYNQPKNILIQSVMRQKTWREVFEDEEDN